MKRHGVRVGAIASHQPAAQPPGGLGMLRTKRERSPSRQRATITEARHRGSIPPDVRHALRLAVADGRLSWHEAGVDVLDDAGDPLALVLSTKDEVRVDRVLLATGFSPRRPGGEMIDALVDSASLPCASCGYPVVDTDLRWHPRIHVTGPLAELELGPTSRNIAGARRAADRLVDMVRRDCNQRRRAS